jgi:hypothetical protein
VVELVPVRNVVVVNDYEVVCASEMVNPLIACVAAVATWKASAVMLGFAEVHPADTSSDLVMIYSVRSSMYTVL